MRARRRTKKGLMSKPSKPSIIFLPSCRPLIATPTSTCSARGSSEYMCACVRAWRQNAADALRARAARAASTVHHEDAPRTWRDKWTQSARNDTNANFNIYSSTDKNTDARDLFLSFSLSPPLSPPPTSLSFPSASCI